MKICALRTVTLMTLLWLAIFMVACQNIGIAEQLESPGKSQGAGFNLVNTIFVTQTTFNGNLGGVAGADNLCRNDAANPMGSGNGVWKALISVAGVRVACTTSDCSGTGAAEHIDWVLKANTQYQRPNGTVIGNTNALGLFVGLLTNPVSTALGNAFTGLTQNWTVAGTHCLSWTSMNMVDQGQSGQTDQSGVIWFSNTAIGCDVPSKVLYCVQQ